MSKVVKYKVPQSVKRNFAKDIKDFAESSRDPIKSNKNPTWSNRGFDKKNNPVNRSLII